MDVAHSYKRIIGYFVDSIIYMLFFLPLTFKLFIFVFSGGLREEAQLIIEWPWLMGPVIFSAGYEVLLLKWTAALPGQMLMGLKVVDETEVDQPLSWGQVWTRVLAARLSIFIGMSGFMMALLNRERRTLADYFAETRVVQSETREKAPREYLIVGVLLTIITFVSGILNAVDYFNALRWTKEGLDIYSLFPF